MEVLDIFICPWLARVKPMPLSSIGSVQRLTLVLELEQ